MARHPLEVISKPASNLQLSLVLKERGIIKLSEPTFIDSSELIFASCTLRGEFLKSDKKSRQILILIAVCFSPLSCVPATKGLNNSGTKEARVVKTADGGEFVIWSEKIQALQWEFADDPQDAVCFLTSYLSKKQVEERKKEQDSLIQAYSKLRTETRTRNLRKFLSDVNNFKNPLKSQKLDTLWPWISRESNQQLAEFGVLIRHFGNFASPFKNASLKRPLSEKGFRQFLDTKISESSQEVSALVAKPLPEPESGLTPAEFRSNTQSAELAGHLLGLGVMGALFIASGGAAIGGLSAITFLASPFVILLAGPMSRAHYVTKTLSAKQEIISQQRADEIADLNRQLAPQQALFQSLKESKNVVEEVEAAEIANMAASLNNEIEKLVAEYIDSGSNEEEILDKFYAAYPNPTEEKILPLLQKFKENTAYYKNTKCPENAKGTSLDSYWMSPANWM
jgi:hypothetical protein